MSETSFPELSEPYDLPETALRRFADDGFVRLDGLLSVPEVEAVRAVVDEVAPRARFETRPLEERDTFGRAFLQHGNLRFLDARLRGFFTSHRLACVAGELLGVDAVRAYHDQALFKEPGGGITPWHQGQFYWPFDAPEVLTLWLPLQDVRPEMGVLQLAVGSHRLGSMGDFHMGDESHAAFDRVIAEMGLPVAPAASYRGGDAVLFRGWTFASETANQTDVLRRVVAMVYFADGIRVARLDHPVRLLARDTFFPGTREGEPAAGARTPVAWRRPVR